MEIYALAAFCWGIGGIINGVTGFGLALVAMPLFSQYVDLIYVVPACTLIAISMNIQLSWTYRHSTDWAGLRPLIIGAFPGAIIGATVLSRMSEPGIKLLMGILLLGYSLWSLFFPHTNKEHFSTLGLSCRHVQHCHRNSFWNGWTTNHCLYNACRMDKRRG